jgi:hypothetical protein
MNATLDPTATEVECESPANRMSGYFATAKPKRQLPKTPQERHELLSDCVMEAILAARDLLNDEDKSVVLKAAETILKVERTRIRHDRNVSGCIPPLQKIDPSQFEEQEDAERPKSHSYAERRNEGGQRGHSIASGDEEMLLAQLEKNLGMMFGNGDDDEDVEEEAPAPVPSKPAPVYAKTEEEALDWHTDELREGLRRVEKFEPGGSVKDVQNDAEARMLVGFHLNEWKMKAIEIPKGGFWRTVAGKMKK